MTFLIYTDEPSPAIGNRKTLGTHCYFLQNKKSILIQVWNFLLFCSLPLELKTISSIRRARIFCQIP